MKLLMSFDKKTLVSFEKKTDERKALEQIIRTVLEGKTIVIEPDFEKPYTLAIGKGDENVCAVLKECEHTHASYAPDWKEEDREKDIEGATNSLVRHLNRASGLSWQKDAINHEEK